MLSSSRPSSPTDPQDMTTENPPSPATKRAKSPPVAALSPLRFQGNLTAEQKLQIITAQIFEIRRQRKAVSPDGSEVSKKKSNKKGLHATEKVPKLHHKIVREYFHPNLEYVMAEVAYSPYLTSPIKHYSEETLTLTGNEEDLMHLGIAALVYTCIRIFIYIIGLYCISLNL